MQAFLDQLLDDSVGKAFAEIFGNAPTTDVVLDEKVAAGVVAYGPKAQELTRTVDWNAVSENRGAWMERFNREMR